jgi:hypothetical protein
LHSGHGLQAWWLLSEFWQFEREADRLAAADVARRWNTAIGIRAAQVGNWVVDSTFDLARVMRVPGTLNRKTTPSMPVVIRAINGVRYHPDDFPPFFVEAPTGCSSGGSIRELAPLDESLRPGKEPPDAQWDAACAVDDRLPLGAARLLGFDSASEHDLSIASVLAYGGWPDQLIVDVLYWNRKRRGEDLKSTQYYARTVRTARGGRS